MTTSNDGANERIVTGHEIPRQPRLENLFRGGESLELSIWFKSRAIVHRRGE